MQLQKDVQNWLSPPDPSTNHDFVWKSHHAGTATWFFESDALTKWKQTETFLWIHGKRMLIHLSARDSHLRLIGAIAGSGKSTLLYVLSFRIVLDCS